MGNKIFTVTKPKEDAAGLKPSSMSTVEQQPPQPPQQQQQQYANTPPSAKGDEIKKEDIKHNISIHQDNVWNKIIRWETLDYENTNECKLPRMKQVDAKTSEYSPQARMRHWLGHELPFERQDWIVDRCGKDVRYIVDYYNDGKNGELVRVDVRPALDSFRSLNNRCRAAYCRWKSKSEF